MGLVVLVAVTEKIASIKGFWLRSWRHCMALMVRLLRWLYWRYAAVGDERLLAKRDVVVGDERLLAKRGAAVLAVPPSAMRFRVVASADKRVLFETNDSRKVKTRYHDLVDVELWDGNRCRGRR